MHVDATGMVLVANQASADLLGVDSPDLLVGTMVDDHPVSADRGVLAEGIDRTPVIVDDIDDPEHHVAFEARALRDDGDTRDVEITVHRTGSSEAPALLRFQDRSRRNGHRRALDQARHRFHQAFESAPTGMALVRLDDPRTQQRVREILDVVLDDDRLAWTLTGDGMWTKRRGPDAIDTHARLQQLARGRANG